MSAAHFVTFCNFRLKRPGMFSIQIGNVDTSMDEVTLSAGNRLQRPLNAVEHAAEHARAKVYGQRQTTPFDQDSRFQSRCVFKYLNSNGILIETNHFRGKPVVPHDHCFFHSKMTFGSRLQHRAVDPEYFGASRHYGDSPPCSYSRSDNRLKTASVIAAVCEERRPSIMQSTHSIQIPGSVSGSIITDVSAG